MSTASFQANMYSFNASKRRGTLLLALLLPTMQTHVSGRPGTNGPAKPRRGEDGCEMMDVDGYRV